MALWNKLFGNKSEEPKVNVDEISERLFMYYKIARSKSDVLGSSVISIGNNTYEYEGVATCASKFLAVCIRNDDGTGANIADAMGMNVSKIQDKFYYQFVVRTHLSVREKNIILTLVANRICKEYPNDYLKQESEILYCVIDSKDFIEEMNALK